MPVSREDPFVGRVRELQELRAAYADARARRGGVHLILGDPGVGKTRLASALSEHAAADGAVVVWTRGWGRAAPAYWPWVEVVRGLCHDVEGDTLRRELGGAADELLRLAPELAERLPGAQPPIERDEVGEDASEIARFTLFDALVTLLRVRSAQAPVVVLIDDLQAVDEGSLVALDFVSRMLRDLAVLLVVTMHERVPQRSPDGQIALSNIVRAGRRLVLGGLSSDDVGRLIELASGIEPPPALALAVHARTEGNAFFTREIVALLVAEGCLNDPPDEMPLPDGVRDTIRRRLVPLGDDAVRTLELAAIFGRTFRLPALERASPLDRDVVLAALERAAGLGIVVELPGAVGQYRFGHGLIAETLLADMSLRARMSAHEAAGEALEVVYRGALDVHLHELAHHFLQAAPRGDVYRAVDYAQRAAQRALDSLAYEQAADLFARALDALEVLEVDVPRRASLLLGLGTAQSRAGRPAARATFDAAIAAARSIGAHDTFARAALGAAPFALTPGFVDESHVALLVEALERIGSADGPLCVRLMSSLARALYWSGEARRRAALAHAALQMARRLDDPATLAFALSSAQLATGGPDATEQGLEWLRELFALTEPTGESMLSLDARSRHVDLLLELDDLAGADVAIEALERLARETRDPHAAAFAPLQRARRATIEGRFEDARDLLASVAELSGELPATTVPMSVASQLAVLNWVQRGPASLGEDVRAYADSVPAMPIWRAALAASLAAGGRLAEARLEFDRLAADDFAALPRDNLWFGAVAALTETVAVLNLPDRALELYEQLAPYAGRNIVTPTVAFLGPVDMWLGILACAGGRGEAALEHLSHARTSATRNGARVSLPRISVHEADVLIELGGADRRACAEALIARAAADGEALGSRSVLDHVARLRERLAGLGPALRAPPAPARPAGAGRATMRRVGDVWTIDDGRTRLHLNDGRGIRLLALLLERPGREVHSLELVAIVDGVSRPPGALRGGLDGSGAPGGQGGAGPRLDAAAKRAYRARLEELPAEIADAQARADEPRAARARAELEFVRRELELAVGLGGRDRSEAGSHAERARVNVTRALRSTLKRIAGYDARLGRELDGSVRTGTYCVYEPDPRRPLQWTVESRTPR
jgi:tetratricopeptide (TPR) repeat protein